MSIGRREYIYSTLSEQAKSNTLPHALLLIGPQGSGALDLALTLVSEMQQPPASEGLFGAVKAPRSEMNWNHPDLHFSFPFINTKTGGSSVCDDYVLSFKEFIRSNPFATDTDWLKHHNDQLPSSRKNPKGNINASECGSILRKLSLKSFSGGRKIVIIWYPEYLGKEGNRLLKTIEEPSANSQIILIAENRQMILPTIQSRCRIVSLPPFDSEEIENSLREKFVGLPSSQIEFITHFAAGDLRRALILAEGEELFDSKFFLEWFRLCFKKDHTQLFGWIESFSRMGLETQKQFVEYVLHFLHQLIRLHFDPQTKLKLDTAVVDSAVKMKKILDIPRIEILTNLMNVSRQKLLRNANAKILMADLSLQVHAIMHTGKIPDYIELNVSE